VSLAGSWSSPRTTFVRWAVLFAPWLILVAVLVASTLRSDRADLAELMASGGRATATIVSAHHHFTDVSYVNDRVGQVVVTDTTVDGDVGDVREVVYDPVNPFRVRPADEPVRGDLTWLVVTVAVAAAVLTLGVMQWSARRFRRIARDDSVSFRMLAVTHGRSWQKVPFVSLFALDVDPGDRCVCTVRLADPDAVELDAPFEVDVKGLPRPGGRLVVRRSDVTLWTRGRALLTARRRWEPHRPPARVPRRDPVPLWSAIALTAGGVVLVVAVVIVTSMQGDAVDAWMAVGRPAVATVADRDDPEDLLAVDVVVHGVPSDVRAMFAPVRDPGEYETGQRFPAVVSQDGTRVRLLAEPYDRATPRWWAAVSSVFVAWLLLRRVVGV
jgi:hypothetical protein